MIYDLSRYAEMIREEKWEDLSREVELVWTKNVLATTAEALSHEEMRRELAVFTDAIRDNVILAPGSGIGYTYEKNFENWKKLEADREIFLRDEMQIADPLERRFLKALTICHVPFHSLEAMPSDIPMPYPFHLAFLWALGGLEKAPEEGSVLNLKGECGEEITVTVKGGERRVENSAGGPYTAFEGEGTVSGYTTKEVRPVTLECYDNYPDNVRVCFEHRRGDEAEYERSWQEYLQWTRRNEYESGRDFENELAMVMRRMRQQDDEEYERRRREERYGSFGISFGGGSYGGGYGGGNYGGGYGGGYGGSGNW